MKNTIALITIILLVLPVAFAAVFSFGEILAVSPVALAVLPSLFVAAKEGNLSEVKRLLENGANVNCENKLGWTALMLAAWKGHSEVAKVLLDNGANVNKGGAWTALMAAAWKGHSKVVKVLLNNGADVNYENKDGLTALEVAKFSGQIEAAKVLDHVANVNYENKDSLTALIVAAVFSGQIEVAKVLDYVANVNYGNKDNLTALIVAAVFSGQIEVAKVLINNGANVNATNKQKTSEFLEKYHNEMQLRQLFFAFFDKYPNNVKERKVLSRKKAAEHTLFDAVKFGKLSKIKRLLNNEVDMNATDTDGKTALMLAAEWYIHGNSEVVKVLLDNGANVNYKDENGKTALMSAALLDKSEVAKVLLDNGANVNDEIKNGWTVLMLAIFFGQNEVAKVLLDNGANPDIINKDGQTAWDFAKDKPILSAILKKHINDVAEGLEFPPCDKTVTN